MRISRITELLAGWPRRLLALSCLLLAAVSGLHAAQSKSRAAISVSDVVIATHTVAAGATLSAADLRVVQWPTALRPSTALRSVDAGLGRRLAVALETGDVLTAQRLVGADLTAGLPAGMIAAPVTLADSGSASLIRPGDHVDLLSTGSDSNGDDSGGSSAASGSAASVIALDVLVLAVLPAAADSSGGGSQLVVAADHSAELHIAQAAADLVLATVTSDP